ncbi:MAG: hypothetical protein QNJ68_07880 [Microcoleaceae cyanobacterium MO_207.B10]|nr:hypothetical protein [Microcoleaceae cyanobacterium MO_207.B10]
MFGFNNNSHPKIPRTAIQPNNYGYSHVFIDDCSRIVLDWEQKGGIPTEAMAENIEKKAAERKKEAEYAERIEKAGESLSDSNARIIEALANAKSNEAQGIYRQNAAYSKMFNKMDKIQSKYDFKKEYRQQQMNKLQESYSQKITDLRSNSNDRQKTAAASRN